jgi:hypothetical protein
MVRVTYAPILKISPFLSQVPQSLVELPRDLSILIEGRFARWSNRRHGRYRALGGDRYKSVLLEGG